MLQVLSVSSSSLDFSNSNYNYDNANANASFHLGKECSINLAHTAKNNLTNKSAGTLGESDLSKQRAMNKKECNIPIYNGFLCKGCKLCDSDNCKCKTKKGEKKR